MKSYYLFLAIILLSSCSQENSSNNIKLSQQSQDSIITAKVDSFNHKFADKFLLLDAKFDKMRVLLTNLQSKPLASKIQMETIVCGGYSDSCRFNPDYLGNLIQQTVLLPDSTSYKQFGYLGSHEVLGLFRKQQEMKSNSYIPMAIKMANYSFKSVLEELQEDFFNVKSIWEAKWYVVLDIDKHEFPTSEYGGGSLKGKWHIFNFNEVEYMGSLDIIAENTPGFNPDLVEKKSETSSRTEMTRLTSGQHLVSTETTTSESSTYNSKENQYQQAGFNLHKNFKKQCKKILEENCLDKEGKSSYISY